MTSMATGCPTWPSTDKLQNQASNDTMTARSSHETPTCDNEVAAGRLKSGNRSLHHPTNKQFSTDVANSAFLSQHAYHGSVCPTHISRGPCQAPTCFSRARPLHPVAPPPRKFRGPRETYHLSATPENTFLRSSTHGYSILISPARGSLRVGPW